MVYLKCSPGRRGRTALAVLIAAAAGQAAKAGGPVVIPASLSPAAGAPTHLELRLPAGPDRTEPTWATANVAQFFVRSAGEQRTLLPIQTTPDRRRAVFSLDKPGPALLCVAVGPPQARGHSDSWQRVTHCTKIVLTVRSDNPQAPRGAPNPGITAKTGQKVEILPLVDPTRLNRGDDLPVRVYYQGVKVKGAMVMARVYQAGLGGPSVEIQAARRTDAQGTTWLPVTRAGTWVVRFIHEAKPEASTAARPQPYVAELIFEVATEGKR